MDKPLDTITREDALAGYKKRLRSANKLIAYVEDRMDSEKAKSHTLQWSLDWLRAQVADSERALDILRGAPKGSVFPLPPETLMNKLLFPNHTRLPRF
jgi:hypothetical protein